MWEGEEIGSQRKWKVENMGQSVYGRERNRKKKRKWEENMVGGRRGVEGKVGGKRNRGKKGEEKKTTKRNENKEG